MRTCKIGKKWIYQGYFIFVFVVLLTFIIKSRSITITFGDVCENHARMQKLGTLANEGFSVDVLKIAKKEFEERGRDGDLVACELFSLNDLLLRAHGTQIGETEFSNINEAMVCLSFKILIALFFEKKSVLGPCYTEWSVFILRFGKVEGRTR